MQAFIDAAADAVAREIASVRREAKQARELQEAEHRARLAELQTRLLAVADLERQVAERLAGLKDGKQGPQGERGQEGAPGPAGKDGQPGAQGPQGDQGERGPVGIDGIDLTVSEDGRSFELKFIRDDVADVFEVPLIEGPQGPQGEAGARGERGADGRDGEVGPQGERGERGEQGPEGRLPGVKTWAEGVHYQAEVVAHQGRTWQAMCDTGQEPGGADWICLAERGEDAAQIEVRGTWDAEAAYSRLNVVALNGATFIAKTDQPGPCPGEGWQLMSAQGKRGPQGERGLQGEKGERGAPGPTVKSISLDDFGVFSFHMSNGETVHCDARPVLERIIQTARAS